MQRGRRVRITARRLASLAVAPLLEAACVGTAHQSTGCEDCSARTTATLPQRLVIAPESGGSSCPRVITDPGGHRLTLLRVLPNDRADYTITPGLYGARENEALRLHCKDGTVAGLVHL